MYIYVFKLLAKTVCVICFNPNYGFIPSRKEYGYCDNSLAWTRTYHLVSKIHMMTTDKEGIKSLEVGFSSLQESMNIMEMGFNEKMHQLEEVVNQLFKTLISNK